MGVTDGVGDTVGEIDTETVTDGVKDGVGGADIDGVMEGVTEGDALKDGEGEGLIITLAPNIPSFIAPAGITFI